MTFEKNFDSNQIKVNTENGEVFLMGVVTRQEAEKAIAITKTVSGVQKV
ncbi:MAG: BON domain-containing protein, partial [Gammaproteobacteria bacterium CG22_combo_CG10-13_8_21_14_all_40_8]